MNTQSISALRAKIWYNKLFADVPTILFFTTFMGEKSSSIIQVRKDLTKKKGDTIEFGLSVKLSGDGVEGDDELEGNEEEIVTYNDTLKINQLRHAVRLKGEMDEQKVAYDMREDAKEKLKTWWAERIDSEIIWKLSGRTDKTFANTPVAPSANRAVWAGGAANDNALTAAMKFDTKVMVRAKQLALTASPKVRPISMAEQAYKGKSMYIMVVHPFQADDLRNDPVWNQAQRDANVRGKGNPILDGCLGVYNNIIVYEHEGMYAFNNSGAVPIARALLLGQQAGVFGQGRDMKWVEKDFDYGNKPGFSAGRIFGVIKPQFNSEDYGVVTVATAAAAFSTA